MLNDTTSLLSWHKYLYFQSVHPNEWDLNHESPPSRFKSIGLSYITLSSVCRLLTAISLLHTTEWDIESHSWTIRSNPAVRNCDKEGWAASAQSSSVWPSTTGLNPRFSEPTRIQLRVVPTISCEPRPSDTVRIPPKCSAIWNWNVKFEWFKIPILPS